MSTDRRAISAAEEIDLLSQVDQACPNCGASLFHKKDGRSFKTYEIAHIYPLNPTPAERALLNGEERLGDDVNDVENLIPLCRNCHGKFDKPRTRPDYRDLLDKKRQILVRAESRTLQREYQLQEEIGRVVDALDDAEFAATSAELTFNAKLVDNKLNDAMPFQVKRKIRNNVNEYFVYVRQRFQKLDREKPGMGDLISSQVKTFYLAQKSLGWNQQQIFSNVVEWIVSKTETKTTEAAEIVASFFVQNCEVFE